MYSWQDINVAVSTA